MRTRANKFLCSLKVVIFSSIILLLHTTPASSEETYVFERMWPNPQQALYLYSPMGIAIDNTGNIYFSELQGNCIQKVTSGGQLITKWGSMGSNDGEFSGPMGLTIDGNQNIYVVDYWNSRIQKFTMEGQFITKWGSEGSGDGQFRCRYSNESMIFTGIAVDADGYVYVADNGNYRIQKFTSNGQFVTKWGTEGTADGQFSNPSGVSVDGSGNIYVADSHSNRIQKFTSDGQFITKWGSQGTGDGQFNEAVGISIDVNGNVYVADGNNYRIQKFTQTGQFIDKWVIEFYPQGIAVDSAYNMYVTNSWDQRIRIYSSTGQTISAWGPGDDDEDLKQPSGVAVDQDGSILVSDQGHSQIKKFSSDGDFISKIGGLGPEDVQFSSPTGIAIATSGNFYVVDYWTSRIQKFTMEGQFITKWGSEGSDDGEFRYPQGIAVDESENVYVVDNGNNRIQKFTSDGQFITKWGTQGWDNGQFSGPWGIAVHENKYVYVADTWNNRVQKFTLDGQYVELPPPGFETWEFDNPSDVAVDVDGNLYVLNHGGQILKFTSDWKFITQFGESGSNPGQLKSPVHMTIAPDGKVYVADTGNHRIQVFSKEGSPITDTSKAIIVAGGGPFPGNNLWDATEMNANYAYRALTYQGFTKDTIYYLSSDTDLDLDGNGKPDDVDADATNANLQYAINTWAKDAEDLFIYMVDHGGKGTFRMGATEILQATDLDTWLDGFQQNNSSSVTMVYDACESGSFLPLLLPPAGKERTLVTSTSAGQESIFVANGTVSFSFLFWGHMFNGDSFYDAFVNGKSSIVATYNQTPLLDANGNGVGNEKTDKEIARAIKIGNQTKSAGDIPMIGNVSPAQTVEDGKSALIYAKDVTDANGISRVWAVITPPNYTAGSPENPVTDLPIMDLTSVGNNQYEGTYTSFTLSGTYNIAIFATDTKGTLSLPVQTTVTVTGGCLSVAGDLSIWVPCVQYNGTRYGFTLNFYSNPDDKSGYYWKLDMSTLTGGTGTDVIPIGGDLSMPIPCVSYNGTQYGFTLMFYNNSYDPSGLYWKMDMSTLEVK